MRPRRALFAGRLRIGEAVVIIVVCAALSISALTLILSTGSHSGTARARARGGSTLVQHSRTATAGPGTGTAKEPSTTKSKRHPRPNPSAAYSVGTVTIRMMDPSRRIGATPRSFLTIVRYPRITGANQDPGPFPLIVFGHGFAVSPGPYAALLGAWTRAGYVVAAPIFPLENANHPGGPDEHDLPNQPGDMSLVITYLSDPGLSDAGPLTGLIDTQRVAVTGQSDGGDTALAAAYDPAVRDNRIGAAMILSGAEDPFAAQFTMSPDGPPLLAVQGTADTINPPGDTYAFFQQAAPPKFLLKLLGAGHQPPYTEPGPQLDAVERTTIAFLDWRFKHRPAAFRGLLSAGNAGPGTTLTGSG